jgi:hypothetical protein
MMPRTILIADTADLLACNENPQERNSPGGGQVPQGPSKAWNFFRPGGFSGMSEKFGSGDTGFVGIASVHIITAARAGQASPRMSVIQRIAGAKAHIG